MPIRLARFRSLSDTRVGRTLRLGEAAMPQTMIAEAMDRIRLNISLA